VQIEWFNTSDTDRLGAVTATVTTFGRDNLTERVTTFDLDDPDGRAAADRLVNLARAGVAIGPAVAVTDGATLELVTDDSDAPGVHQHVKEYTLRSSDYGAFVDIAVVGKVGFDVNVNVTHLE